MTFPHSHKTVIVLDRSPHLLKSSKQMIEYDVFTKSRAPGIIPLAPIAKTLWTCNVEASVEYARIIYDIFPTDKLLRYIVSDSSATNLNSWSQTEQNVQQIMMGLAQLGPPSKEMKRDDCSVLHGLTQAIECLCEPSSTQHEMRTSLRDDASCTPNRGQIICLTFIKNESYVRILEECVQDALSQHNKLAASTDNLMPITSCELVLVHIFPVGADSTISNKSKTPISGVLSSEVHVSQSGHHIAAKLVELAITHYKLASTTVTGIPMKEEQNASSSANYDVELLHPAAAHDEVLRSAVALPGHAEGLGSQSRESSSSDTITLKWCTPKSNIVELHQCAGAFRITPVDVNSRPSSCLTNFLLNGRAVMLEQPRKTGLKVMSHMLASHGGEIYIHTLATSRSPLEEPPSISEGCGGRVTDYRINDFGEFMKENRLAPVAEGSVRDELPLERAQAQLERMTRFWPMVISESIIFNMMSQLDPLPSLIVKERLDDEEVLDCKKAIYHVVGMESRNEALPVPATGTRGKGPKREEQYRLMWSELERLIRAHSATSPGHEKVLECLLECKRPTEGTPSPVKPTPMKEEPAEAEMAWKEIDRFNKMTEREKQDMNKSDVKSELPPIKKMKTEPLLGKSPGGQSLLNMWTSRLSALHKGRHAEFDGRLESTGNIAELYKHPPEDMDDLPINNTASIKK